MSAVYRSQSGVCASEKNRGFEAVDVGSKPAAVARLSAADFGFKGTKIH